MSETPWDELEQAPLWIEEAPGMDARRAELDARRAEWIEARRRHAVGSEREVEARVSRRLGSVLDIPRGKRIALKEVRRGGR